MYGRADAAYPMVYHVDYPTGSRNRLTTLLRPILAIPILVILLFSAWQMFIPTFLVILFRNRYPRTWFNSNLDLLRFVSRVNAYTLLLRDEYPSVDDEQAVHLNVAYPEDGCLNRFMPLAKWFLAIPHYVALLFLWIAVFILTAIAWFAIIIVGRYPRGMFHFVEGVDRWTYRVTAYLFMMVTDRYPPFRLGE